MYTWNNCRGEERHVGQFFVHLGKHGFSITPVVVRRTGYHYTLKSAFIGLPAMYSSQSYESHTHFQSWNDRAAFRAACTAILRSEVHPGKHGFSITPVVVRRTGYHYTLKSAFIGLPESCGTNSSQSYESHTHFQSWNDSAFNRHAMCSENCASV